MVYNCFNMHKSHPHIYLLLYSGIASSQTLLSIMQHLLASFKFCGIPTIIIQLQCALSKGFFWRMTRPTYHVDQYLLWQLILVDEHPLKFFFFKVEEFILYFLCSNCKTTSPHHQAFVIRWLEWDHLVCVEFTLWDYQNPLYLSFLDQTF